MSTPPEVEDILALSPLQEGFFSLAAVAGDEIDVYSMQFVTEIIGPLRTEVLRAALEAMLHRHPNLRVSFWDRDLPKPVQIVPSHATLPWRECTVAAEEFDALCAAERATRFDLTRGPALRVVLATLPTGRRRLILTAHHILMDGWSLAVFYQELVQIYDADGRAGALPPPRPYRDYIAWLNSRDTDAALATWVEYVGANTEPLLLADSAATGPVAARNRFRLDTTETSALTGWAGEHGLTLNTVVQFAWAVLLGRLTGRRDIVFGTIVAGRPENFDRVESMVGLFINTVPVAVRLEPGSPVTAQCARLQRDSVAMRDIGYLGLSTVHRALEAGALFDTLLVFENAPVGSATGPTSAADGVEFVPVTMESLAHYPLTVVCYLLDGTLEVVVETLPGTLNHLRPGDIGARLLEILRLLPAGGDTGPDALEVLFTHERERLGIPALPPAAESIPQLFAAQAAATPQAPALTTRTEHYTYAELHAAVGRAAAELVACGVQPEDVVVVALPRSPGFVIAMLAVLTAGAAYVPLDLPAPPERLASILRQSRPTLILTDTAGRDEFTGGPSPVPVHCLGTAAADTAGFRAPAVRPDQRAYVIFTSGSTGEPKGVTGTHAALAAYFHDHRDQVYRPAVARTGRPLRIAHAWTMAFDASWQPLVGLLDGHAVHLFDTVEMRDPDALVAGITATGIDMIDTSPSMLTQLWAAGLPETSLTVLALGGEAIDPQLWRRLGSLSDTAVYNCYGPTETTVEAVVARLDDTGTTPVIGAPTAGTAAYVLDPFLRPVPDGVAGELYLSGAQLTRGYAGRPDLTAGHFVADPFTPGARMYRTGDLVRWTATGHLAYLGRIDDQVKIRGHRIELGEIDSALRELPGVQTAAVTVVPRDNGPVLVGFVTGVADTSPLPAALADRLPGYMLPARIVALPALPITANGKLDSRNLLEQAISALGAVGESAPQTPAERLLSTLFAELFDGVRPGIDDDFFALGVDSIVAISLVNSARRHELAITPRMVLENTTIRRLAAAAEATIATPDLVAATDGGSIPALPIVDWTYRHGRFRRFTQTTLVVLPRDLSDADLTTALQAVLDAHPVLGSTLSGADNEYRLEAPGACTVQAADVLDNVTVTGDLGAAIAAHARPAFDRIDPFAGRNIRAVRFHHPDGDHDVLLWTIHHLVADVVSWHILIGDLAEAARQQRAGEAPKVLGEFTTYRQWAELLHRRATDPRIAEQRQYWARQLAAPDPALGHRLPDPQTDTWSTLRVLTAPTPVSVTAEVLAVTAHDIEIREFLLTALTITFAQWRTERGQDPSTGALIALEGHGRTDDIAADIDTSRTVGWFTTVFPVRLGAGETVDLDRATADPAAAVALLTRVQRHLAEVPGHGLDFGLLQSIAGAPELTVREPQAEFNYLGRLDLADTAARRGAPWTQIGDLELMNRLPLDPEPELPLRYALDVIAAVGPTADGVRLMTMWRWSTALFEAGEVDRLADIWQRAVAVLAGALSRR